MLHPLRVLLVEDDWAVREAVSDYLLRQGMVVIESDSLEAALVAAEQSSPDVAIIDIVFPERPGEPADFGRHMGIKAARLLRERCPNMGIVFLSAYMDRGPEVLQLFVEGHDRIAYLLKGTKPKELLDAIHKVSQGSSALEIGKGVRATRTTSFDEALKALTEEEAAFVSTALAHMADLSEPEMRVFEEIGSCRTRQKAVEGLHIRPSTISSHMDAIYAKLYLREGNNSLNPLMLLAKIHLLHHLRRAESSDEP